MTTTNLRVKESDWIRLRKHFASSFSCPTAPETGAIGVVSECVGTTSREFVVAKVLWPEPADLKVAENQELVFHANYIRRAHVLMRSERLAGLIMFHTHPLSDATVGFSLYDDHQEPKLVANLREIEPTTELVSVVVGRHSLFGRVWDLASAPERLGRLIVVGESLSFHLLSGQPDSPPPTPAAVFDRALAVTGAGALARLGEMTVAIVGTSGTGSLVSELLVRAGCKRLMLIDHDVAQDINLNRLLYLTPEDVRNRTPKVEILRRGIEGLGLGCCVEPVNDNVLDCEIVARLRDADVIFGCVDRAYPRLIMSQFAFQYMRPYIDVGSEIGANTKGIIALNARVNYVGPGRSCLVCTGLVTPRQLHFESLTIDERQRVVQQGYSDDLTLKQPAVMDLNMHAAAYGVMVLRHLLQPFLLTPLPVTISENLATYTTLPISEARNANPECQVCQNNSHTGFADYGPTLGLDKATLRRITDANR